MRKTYLLLSLVFSTLLPTLFAAESSYALKTFSINPYLILGQDLVPVLKFQLRKTIPVDIKVTEQHMAPLSEHLILQQRVTEREFQEIPLLQTHCSSVLKLTFSSGDSSNHYQQTFQTYPCHEQEELVLGFLSDTQQNNGHAQVGETINKLLPQGPHVLLQGGDIVHFGARQSEWLNHFAVAKNYYDKAPVVAAIGNHEYWYSYLRPSASSAYFRQYMRESQAARTGELFLEFPQINLIVINSNLEKISRDDQWRWLEERLHDSEQDNKRVIVMLHHSPFTSGAGSARSTTLKNDLVSRLEKSPQVRLVLSGHEHIYERSLKNNIHYLVAGPAGGLKYRVTNGNRFRQFVDDRARTFTLIKIKNYQLVIKTYNQFGTAIDEDFIL